MTGPAILRNSSLLHVQLASVSSLQHSLHYSLSWPWQLEGEVSCAAGRPEEGPAQLHCSWVQGGSKVLESSLELGSAETKEAAVSVEPRFMLTELFTPSLISEGGLNVSLVGLSHNNSLRAVWGRGVLRGGYNSTALARCLLCTSWYLEHSSNITMLEVEIRNSRLDWEGPGVSVSVRADSQGVRLSSDLSGLREVTVTREGQGWTCRRSGQLLAEVHHAAGNSSLLLHLPNNNTARVDLSRLEATGEGGAGWRLEASWRHWRLEGELDWKQRGRNGSWSVKLEGEVPGLGEFHVVRCLAYREGWGLEVRGEDRLPLLAPVTSRSGVLAVYCGGTAMLFGLKILLPQKQSQHQLALHFVARDF